MIFFVLVLLLAHVKRFIVSCMQDFILVNHSYQYVTLNLQLFVYKIMIVALFIYKIGIELKHNG